MYEVGMNIVRKGGLSGTLKKRACISRLVGIKNSWKYEKDLIIILNIRNTFVPIGLLGNYFIPQVVKVDFMQIIIIDKV